MENAKQSKLRFAGFLFHSRRRFCRLWILDCFEFAYIG